MPPSGKGSAHTREVSRRRPSLARHSAHARIRMSTSPSSPERLLSLAVTTSFRATMLSTLVSFRMRAGSATWPGELSVTKARRTASRFLLLRSSLLSAASMVATMSTKPRLVEPRHAPGTGRSSISAGTTARRRAQCWDTWHLRFSQLSPPAATFSTVLRSAVGIARSGASAVPCDVWRGEGNTRRTGHSHTATPETREDENAPAIENCPGHPMPSTQTRQLHPHYDGTPLYRNHQTCSNAQARSVAHPLAPSPPRRPQGSCSTGLS